MGKLLRGARPLNRMMMLGLAASALATPLALPLATSAATAAPSASMDAEIANFYRSRGGAPLWFSPAAGPAAQQLLSILATAQADGLNPRRYDVRALTRAVEDARRGGNVQRAEAMLSAAFVAFARDQRRDPNIGVIYVDPELRPQPPSAMQLLSNAARARSLSDYVQNMGWMSPIYGKLRAALASRLYGNQAQRQLLQLNLERARALPPAQGRYVIVNPPAARLYMYEDGQVVDSMRVVAGKPTAAAQTPMMNAYMRFVVLNPYWNSPPDVTAKNLAPNVLKQGTSYLRAKGYEVMSDWSENARVVSPASIDWNSVVAGRKEIRLRQKPGPANSMGSMKFMFPNAQGIWLHDTPQKEKIEDAARLQSNGCVRLEDARRLARWLFNGRAPKAQGARAEQRVSLPQPVPIYITYLTAVPSGTSIVYFDDFYGKDRGQARRMAAL